MSFTAASDEEMSVRTAMAIGHLDCHDQIALVRSGEIAQSDLVRSARIRIDVLNPALNAVVHLSPQSDDTGSASGPMAGVPWLLKDGLDYRGLPKQCGSRALGSTGLGTQNFEFSERLEAGGLRALGKTNVPEFALLPTTESLLYGEAINPWDPKVSPGGSSGGSAVAVASGMVPIAHAADGGGSTRIPASCCGLVGLKTSRGANVRARGPHLIEDMLTSDSVFTRSVRDTAWAFATAHPDYRDPVVRPDHKRLKIAVLEIGLNGKHPSLEVSRAVRSTARLCESLEHEIELIDSPVDGQQIENAFKALWGFVAIDCLNSTRSGLGLEPALNKFYEPWTLALAEWGQSLRVEDTENIYLEIASARLALQALFERYDCVLSPVMSLAPPKLGYINPELDFDTIMDRMFDYIPYTPLHNLTGHPAISLPLNTTASGVPIGSMFSAGHGQDELLISLALELEAARPWAGIWPAQSVAAYASGMKDGRPDTFSSGLERDNP